MQIHAPLLIIQGTKMFIKNKEIMNKSTVFRLKLSYCWGFLWLNILIRLVTQSTTLWFVE